MKTTKTFTSLLFIILIINACSKGCPEGDKPIDKGVDKTYLAYIIPYSDTSTRLFLKNGKDTLLFKSQGLKETFTIEGAAEICDKYKLQEYSLKMAASDTDFFEIKYYAIKTNIPKASFIINSIEMNGMDDSRYLNYTPWRSLVVLTNKYDSISISKNNYGDTIYSKQRLGVIRIKSINIYELIK
ncbi:MAG: hypothetical protein ACOYMA_16725 [Bacteroidia bacterium]